jgi:hypothetical protein
MRFKSPIWKPIAIVLSAGNLVAVGYHAGATEPWQAATHAALALGFGLWAQRLRSGSGPGEREDRLEEIEGEVSDLRRELSEAQERLDFTERMLVAGQEVKRAEKEH